MALDYSCRSAALPASLENLAACFGGLALEVPGNPLLLDRALAPANLHLKPTFAVSMRLIRPHSLLGVAAPRTIRRATHRAEMLHENASQSSLRTQTTYCLNGPTDAHGWNGDANSKHVLRGKKQISYEG